MISAKVITFPDILQVKPKLFFSFLNINTPLVDLGNIMIKVLTAGMQYACGCLLNVGSVA